VESKSLSPSVIWGVSAAGDSTDLNGSGVFGTFPKMDVEGLGPDGAPKIDVEGLDSDGAPKMLAFGVVVS
jgi:hypothetical protein